LSTALVGRFSGLAAYQWRDRDGRRNCNDPVFLAADGFAVHVILVPETFFLLDK